MQIDLGNLENSLAKSNRALDPKMNLGQNVNPSASALTGATRQQIQRQFCVLSRSTCFRLSRLYSERSTCKVRAFLETSGSGKRGNNCNLTEQPNSVSIFEDFLWEENQQTDSALVNEDFAIGSKTSKYERFCRKVDKVLSVSTLEIEILDEKKLSKTRLPRGVQNELKTKKPFLDIQRILTDNRDSEFDEQKKRKKTNAYASYPRAPRGIQITAERTEAREEAQ
ncbi:hypothetical protein HZH68_014985 [Vespula germanica]|uniref:Uncharacterized protein n=1 Tax=Vespula germanica TaxID=30212 RepID=A0A834J718_VESGE|nr:hypothetical protein HZH68_014985 [Vespula germanica]